MTAPKQTIDLGRMQRRLAAYETFQRGASFEDASRAHDIETHELEDVIRMQWDSGVQDLAEAIAVNLGKTSPAEIEKITGWLKQTMLWIFDPEADLVAEVRSNVDFTR